MSIELASNIIDDVKQGRPLLIHFGETGRYLKRRIAPTCIFSRCLLFLLFNPLFLLRVRMQPSLWKRRKALMARLGRVLFPFKVKGHITSSSKGQVFVINHPTLNDPLCAGFYALAAYPEREIILPVNLPWYEGVSRYRFKLLKIGIKIVPILTPETAKKLGTSDLISKVQTALIQNYNTEFAKTLQDGGSAVVAQQATRQRYIFTDLSQSESGEGILSTVSLILAGFRREKLLEQTCFIPVGVIPHDLYTKPKLNLFREYTLNFGEPIDASDLAAIKNAAKRSADLHILQKLAELLPEVLRVENKND